MLTNEDFLKVILESFREYLVVGTSRSTAKLKILHGKIARDLQQALGPEYTIKSQGYGDDKEECLPGLYYPKNVDIAVSYHGKPLAAYAVKFVMRNYSQNSNNYFESMLGETANLRANGIPYFQIFIIFDKLPYYKKGGEFQKWESITQHNLDKYVEISKADSNAAMYVPNKILVTLLSLKDRLDGNFANDREYSVYYRGMMAEPDLITYSKKLPDVFGEGVILNDYAKFIQESVKIAKVKPNE